jgi:hypothetical protein
MSRMDEIIARDAQWVDALESYNFPPTLGHAVKDVRFLLARVKELEEDAREHEATHECVWIRSEKTHPRPA